MTSAHTCFGSAQSVINRVWNAARNATVPVAPLPSFCPEPPPTYDACILAAEAAYQAAGNAAKDKLTVDVAGAVTAAQDRLDELRASYAAKIEAGETPNDNNYCVATRAAMSALNDIAGPAFADFQSEIAAAAQAFVDASTLCCTSFPV